MDDSPSIEQAYGCEGRGDTRSSEFLTLDKQQVLNIIWDMGESLIVLSPNAQIRFVNQATLEMLGYEASELVGRSFREFVPDDNEDFFEALRTMVAKGPIRDLRLDYVGRGGGRIPVSLNGSVFRDNESGTFYGMVVVARDMRDVLGLIEKLEDAKAGLEDKVVERTSELEKAYSKLKNTQAQLLQSEKMASIGQLAAGLAHELNTPIGFLLSNLGTIETYTSDMVSMINKYDEVLSSMLVGGKAAAGETNGVDELKQKLDMDFLLKDTAKVMEETREGAGRVRNIVADLLAFSRVNSKDTAFADVNQCIESTLKIVCNGFKDKVEIIKDYGEVPMVSCNAGELNQVITNIVANAGHAIEAEGEVRVETSHENGRVLIRISDTGCGIPKENLSRIFEPFFTTKPVGQGTGLGLAMSYSIIKKHSGELTVQSTPGEGTCFTIALPIGLEE